MLQPSGTLAGKGFDANLIHTIELKSRTDHQSWFINFIFLSTKYYPAIHPDHK